MNETLLDCNPIAVSRCLAPVRTRSSATNECLRPLCSAHSGSALSHDARDKLKEIVHEHIDKHPEQTMEQQSTYAQKIYEKIKVADQKAAGIPSKSSSNSNPNTTSSNRGPRPEKSMKRK